MEQVEATAALAGAGPRPLTIAIVGHEPRQLVIDQLVSALDPDIVVIESIEHAYSTIRRTNPHLVIVCVVADDPDTCQLLSMLATDRQTSRMPVFMHRTPLAASEQSDPLEVVDAPDDGRALPLAS